jgi:hypothetical protein
VIEHSDTITNLMGAMLAVQGAVDGVAKDSNNPAFRSKYASLESVVDTIRPHCQKHGLVVMQAPGGLTTEAEARPMIVVETMVVHAESGEWIRSATQIPLTKHDAQGAGSAITYGERYSLMAMFNLPPVDDDGHAASAHSSSPPSSISQQATAARRAPTAPQTPPLPDRDGMLAAVNRSGSMKALTDLIAKPRWAEALANLFPPDRDTIENAVADKQAILSDIRETA